MDDFIKVHISFNPNCVSNYNYSPANPIENILLSLGISNLISIFSVIILAYQLI